MSVEDKIRVLRIIEYVGDRTAVEAIIEESIHGTKRINRHKGICIIRAGTIGYSPEVLVKSGALDNCSVGETLSYCRGNDARHE